MTLNKGRSLKIYSHISRDISKAKDNLDKTEKNQDQIYYSMKAYNLWDHYQQKLKSLISDFSKVTLLIKTVSYEANLASQSSDLEVCTYFY